MIVNSQYYSKKEWRKIVWEKVWAKKDEDCTVMYKQPHQNILRLNVTDKPYYLVCWILSDMLPKQDEHVWKYVISSMQNKQVKGWRLSIKRENFQSQNVHKVRFRDKRVSATPRDAVPFIRRGQEKRVSRVKELGSDQVDTILNDALKTFQTLMGKQPEDTANWWN